MRTEQTTFRERESLRKKAVLKYKQVGLFSARNQLLLLLLLFSLYEVLKSLSQRYNGFYGQTLVDFPFITNCTSFHYGVSTT